MVVDLNSYISSKAYADRLSVVGAIDIELGDPRNNQTTQWSSPVAARAWVDGYASTSRVSYINFGSANGCPPSGTQCNNGWTQEDIWYVSWGNPANPLPVPEIYYNAPPKQPSNALQWAALAALHGGTPMYIPGALTEWQACQDPGKSCAPGYDTPLQAWQQLMDTLYNASPILAPAMQSILYSSDITWQN